MSGENSEASKLVRSENSGLSQLPFPSLNGNEMVFEDIQRVMIPGDIQEVTQFMDRLKLDLDSKGLPQDCWDDIRLAVAEAVNNAVFHGCERRSEYYVSIEWHLVIEESPSENPSLKGFFEIEVTDPGTWTPQPEDWLLPESEDVENGRGLFLMSQLMDEVEHYQSLRGHCVRLKKEFERIPANQSGEDEKSSDFDDVQALHTEVEDYKAQIASMEDVVNSMALELSNAYENISACLEFGEAFAAAPNFPAFVEVSIGRLKDLSGVDAVWVYCADIDGSLRLASSRTDGAIQRPGRIPAGASLIEAQVLTTRLEQSAECRDDFPEADPFRHQDGVAHACPIIYREKILGVLTVYRSQGGTYFSAGDIALAHSLADFVGIALALALLQEQRNQQVRTMQDLRIASDIQHTLLPARFPALETFKVHGVCESAREVGGDFFDVIELSEEESDGVGGVLVVVADVMGKGVPAALVATLFRTIVRARLDDASRPEKMMADINRQMCRDVGQLDLFVTAQLAYFPPDFDRVRLANAGHCPLLKISNGGLERVRPDGGPTALFNDNTYEAVEVPLSDGDRLVFTTDGMFEVEDRQGVMMPREVFDNLLMERQHLQRVHFCEDLLKAVRDYRQGRPVEDDQTLVVVDIKGSKEFERSEDKE